MREFMIQSNRPGSMGMDFATMQKDVFQRVNKSAKQPQVLLLEGLPKPCQLVRSRRKSLAVHVSHDSIEVRAPLSISQREIRYFLEKHRAWVLRKYEEKRQLHNERLQLRDGARIFYKARSIPLSLVESRQPLVSVDGSGGMRICGRHINSERAAVILKAWLMAQAEAWLPDRTRALAAYLGVDNKLRDVVFRKTRSKWGHCTAEGRIQYNWLIMLAPDGVIDYMISHEVCHLLHMNHSKAYWQAVESVCPDYKRYVGWLKTYEHRLWF